MRARRKIRRSSSTSNIGSRHRPTRSSPAGAPRPALSRRGIGARAEAATVRAPPGTGASLRERRTPTSQQLAACPSRRADPDAPKCHRLPRSAPGDLRSRIGCSRRAGTPRRVATAALPSGFRRAAPAVYSAQPGGPRNGRRRRRGTKPEAMVMIPLRERCGAPGALLAPTHSHARERRCVRGARAHYDCGEADGRENRRKIAQCARAPTVDQR
jgi:hypothetical protein